MRARRGLERVVRMASLAVVVGLALVAGLPSGVAPVAAGAGPQAYSDSEALAGDLGREAIAVHAMIEYIFAPARTQVAASASSPTVAASIAVAATAPPPEPATRAEPAPAEPAPEPAPAVPSGDGLSRGEQALARIPVSPASIGFTIEFLPGRSGYGGLTYPDSRRIEIYVDSGWSDAHLTHVIAHEIGHAVDMARNTRSDHDRWRAARGIPATTRWWADPYMSDFATPGGDFAECFAAWALGTTSTRSEFGSCAGTGALMGELVWG